MRLLTPLSLTFALLLFVPRTVFSTNVKGTLASSTWTKANSPYRVTGAITVPAGSTLTIEPGVDVLFDVDSLFIVKGALRALGTPIDSIRFLKGAAAQWGGLRITGGDSSAVAYARISDAHRRGNEWQLNSGGAIFVADVGTRVTIWNSVISGNRADGYGGGVCNAYAKMVIRDCVISGNSAVEHAGAVSNNYSSGVMKMDNCSIFGNTAGDGGGAMENWQSTIVVTNCTFSNNHAVASGGVLVNWGGSTASTTFRNSILWGNTPAKQCSIATGSVTATYSDIQQASGTFVGTGNINSDPLFVNTALNNFQLKASSPCVNTGDPASPLDPDGTRADIGAHWTRILYGDVSGDGSVSGYDASLVLRHVIEPTAGLPQIAAADVTGNGKVTSYDAAQILFRVAMPGYEFPIERGGLGKTAAFLPRALSFDRAGNRWELRVDNAAGVVSGELTILLDGNAPADVTASGIVDYRRVGNTLFVAFARADEENSVLLSIAATSETSPVLANVSLNEGTIATALAKPVAFAFEQNTPNPFNPATTFRFALPENELIEVAVFDVAGQLVRTLAQGDYPAGMNTLTWDGTDDMGRAVASGTYVCRLVSPRGTMARRMTLAR
jgi:hypothetical protein